jgi:hypothetical protein
MSDVPKMSTLIAERVVGLPHVSWMLLYGESMLTNTEDLLLRMVREQNLMPAGELQATLLTPDYQFV